MFLGAQDNVPEPLKVSNGSKVAIHAWNVTYDCATGIQFHWSIKNFSSSTVYVYATFLSGRAADLLEYDQSTNTLLIPTSMKSEVSFPPYSYPEPAFRLLATQELIEGVFSEPISSQLSCKSLAPEKLSFEVAWGNDPSQVMTEISRIKKEGKVHPANPIVHWANLARSEPASIKYLGRNSRVPD
jgi:hypothetical protein